jgi:DNA primase
MGRTDLNSTIERIKERVQLSKIIEADVVLRKKGREFVGQCPFHSEKTASFFVNDDKGTFYCFGCGASGDSIEYLVRKNKITFMQAVERLSEISGIKLPEKTSYKNNFEIHQKILQKATEFFKCTLLSNKRALEYCEQRCIDRQIIETFSIGYAEGYGSRRLLEFLRKSGFIEPDILSSGLFVEKDSGLIERFRDRLMFPVFNRNGWPIAFGGRGISQDSVPKYLNSPESELFQKKETLYGYNIASKNSSGDKQIIVVEGYVDVITMHRFGFNTTVASMGTAFSPEHLAKIWKYSVEPIACLDGDEAGYKAMVRLSMMAMRYLQPGKSVRFCLLPKDMDPDSFLMEKGGDTLRALINNSMSLIDFFWDHCIKQLYEIENKTPEKIAKWKKDMEESLNDIQDPEIKRLYKAELKNRTHSILYKQTNRTKTYERHVSVQKNILPSVNFIERMLTREALLLYAVIVCPPIAQFVAEPLSSVVFSDPKFKVIRGFILDSLDELDFAKCKEVDAVLSIKTIGRENCDIERLDENEILEFWHGIYVVGFCKPLQKQDVIAAKQDCARELSQMTWERLRAIKMDSLYK